MTISQTVQEGALETWTFASIGVSTTGLTVTARVTSWDGTTTEIGTAAGVGENDSLQVSHDFALVGPDTYRYELVADIAGDNPIPLVPSSATADPYLVTVTPRESYVQP